MTKSKWILFVLIVMSPQLLIAQKVEMSLSKLAVDKMKQYDVKGANSTWDSLISYLRTSTEVIYSGENRKKTIGYHLREKALWNFKQGSVREAVITVINIPKEDKIRKLDAVNFNDLLKQAIDNAFYLGEAQMLIELKKIAIDLEYETNEFYALIYAQILNGENEGAINNLLQKKERAKPYDRAWCSFNLAYLYYLTGDIVKSKEYVDQATKSAYFDKRMMSYTKGLLFFKSKDYVESIEQFTYGLEAKNYYNRLTFNGKFQFYTARAEAFEGLKEFDKAKNDYEAALIYNPDYAPALNGLARLEGRIITERKTDKAPPQITITEPAVTRGLIVKAAGNDVMIKGIAADPGGLKSVTINGEKVYSQEGGTFWGNIALKEGVNKVTVAATDFSGNTGEQVFDIERPVSVVALKAEPVKEGRNFALLIGCQNYDDNTIPSLDNPIADAIKLKLILKNNYNFSETNIITLFNPEQSDFKKQFLELNEEILPEDNLVIFYAGHGIWVEKEKKGYWMLTDAKLNDVNTWLPNKEVLNMIARLPARHTLLITDACFSGSVFKTRGLNTDIPLAVQQMNQKISRVAITSGNDTEVPDKSVFMKYLVKALSENKEKYLTAQKMFITQIIEAVMTETKTEPRYGTLELAGHVGGDFIFIKK